MYIHAMLSLLKSNDFKSVLKISGVSFIALLFINHKIKSLASLLKTQRIIVNEGPLLCSGIVRLLTSVAWYPSTNSSHFPHHPL